MELRYDKVPKDFEENLRFRKAVRDAARKSAKLRRELMAVCRDDILFWVNSFCWIFEPRKRYFTEGPLSGRLKPKALPFISWIHQDPRIIEARENLGDGDIVVEKGRDEGWSWIVCTFANYDFLMFDDMAIGLVSSTEYKVDSPSIGSMMGKMDWQLARFPSWMGGREGVDYLRNHSEHTFVHRTTRTQVKGFAGKAEAPRGDRLSWIGIDEHASDDWRKDDNDYKVIDSTGAVTDSRLIISTPNGLNGAFYDITHGDSNAHKIRVWWQDNPNKNRGMYRWEGGKPVAIDPVANPLPADYNPPSQKVLDLFARLRKKGFDLNNRVRSPWLDRECDRLNSTPSGIAKEHELDYGGSKDRYFHQNVIAATEKTTRPPLFRADIQVDREGGWKFAIDPNGPIKFWCKLDAQNSPGYGAYIVCADIASGRGTEYSSNSVAHVIDSTTREQVVEYATSNIAEAEFADQAIALCEIFHDAYLAWENMGPGAAFGNRVRDRGYADVFMRGVYDHRGKLKGKKVGFWNAREARKVMFSDLRMKILDGGVVIRSEELAAELPQYVREGDKILHERNASDDPSHGDRVIAMGVGVQAMKDRPVSKKEDFKPWGGGQPPIGTLAWRDWKQQQDAVNDDERAYGWDDRSTADLMSTDRHMRIGAA